MSKLDELLTEFDRWCLCDSRECQRSVNYAQSKESIKDAIKDMLKSSIKGAYSGSDAIDRFQEKIEAL